MVFPHHQFSLDISWLRKITDIKNEKRAKCKDIKSERKEKLQSYSPYHKIRLKLTCFYQRNELAFGLTGDPRKGLRHFVYNIERLTQKEH